MTTDGPAEKVFRARAEAERLSQETKFISRTHEGFGRLPAVLANFAARAKASDYAGGSMGIVRLHSSSDRIERVLWHLKIRSLDDYPGYHLDAYGNMFYGEASDHGEELTLVNTGELCDSVLARYRDKQWRGDEDHFGMIISAINQLIDDYFPLK